jgi:predicted permease
MKTLSYAEMPFDEGERIVFVDQVFPTYKSSQGALNPYVFQQFKEAQTGFEHFGALRAFRWMSLSDGNNGSYPWTAETSASLFDTLGTQALLGRTLVSEDERPGAAKVAVISYKLWLDIYELDPDILGKTARIEGQTHTIVGVMPEAFRFPINHDLWVPLQLRTVTAPVEDQGLLVFGKLKPGVSTTQAETELVEVMEQLAEEHPNHFERLSVAAWSPTQMFMLNGGFIFTLMGVAATAIMLLVVANVSMLLLARASENTREVAIRSALGAPRSRLMGQTLSESLLLCVSGSVLGIVFAWAGLQVMQSVFGSVFSFPTPYWMTFGLSSDALLLAILATIVAWLLSGMIPAWRASGVNCNEVLKDGNKGQAGKGNSRMVKALVCLLIALSSVLLSTAVGNIRTMVDTMDVDYGVEIENYITGHVNLTAADYPDRASQARFFEELSAELTSRPGIRAASSATHLIGTSSQRQAYNLEDRDLKDEQGYPREGQIAVQNNYFESLGIAIKEGRAFNSGDKEDSTAVVIVDELFAEKLWPGESALGKLVQLNPEMNGDWLTIVGVVPHLIQDFPSGPGLTETAMFRPLAQAINLAGVVQVIAEVEGNAANFAQELVDATHAVDSMVPIDALWTLDKRINQMLNGLKLFTGLFGIFGALALILASGGIYAIMSRATVLRTHELGLRRALGASNGRILRLLLGQASKQLIIGLLLGLLLSTLAAYQILFQQQLTDTAEEVLLFLGNFAIVAAILGAVLIIASLIPARRAVALEPSVALHQD